MLPPQAVLEWKKIYKQTTGAEISVEEATAMANRMFGFLLTVTKPKNLKISKKGVNNERTS